MYNTSSNVKNWEKKKIKSKNKVEIKLNFKDERQIESILQIIILIIATFAFAYIVHESFQGKELIPLISAEEDDVNWNCCIESTTGAICQDISSDQCNEVCKTSCIPSKCEQIENCLLGCCIDEEEGLCTTRAPKEKCENEGGLWQEGENCNIPECIRGCCFLGDNTEYVTEARCEKLSGMYGFEKDFRDVESELECVILGYAVEMGACVFENGGCKFTSIQECYSLGGEFNKDLLCSNPSLETNCERQSSVGCIEGRDEIYWFDSCGNRENIYSSDKEASWNNGRVLRKEEACNPNSNNINSEDCGNCDYALGSKCSKSEIGKTHVKDGNYVCKDLSCIDENGNYRKNGESWCIYDSYIGDGKDTAGSRHWKRVCIDGELKTEPCADYRGEICVQQEIESENGNFQTAACRINEALNCFQYNKGKEIDKAGCEANPDCIIKHINVDKGFKFDFCTSKYPKGFEFTEDGASRGSGLCSMGNHKCTVIYVCGKCVFNCKCETKKFTNQLNDLCISLGDCGSYINYIGQGTNNIKVKGAPKISWEKYKEYAEPVEGQYAEPGSIERALQATGGWTSAGKFGEAPEKYNQQQQDQQQQPQQDQGGGLGAVLGPLGSIAGIAAPLFMKGGGGAAASVAAGSALESAVLSGGAMNFVGIPESGLGGATGVTGSLGAGASALGNALMGFGIGSAVGGVIAQAFGLSGSGAQMVSLAGGVGAAIGGALASGVAGIGGINVATLGVGAMTTTGTSLGVMATMAVMFVWAAVFAVVAALLAGALGLGGGNCSVKKKIVSFKCQPWTPPPGGEHCNECNNDPIRPCSRYRCMSLGAACKIINEDSESPLCVEENPNDVTPPKISPKETQEGYTFADKKENSVTVKAEEDEKGCIPSFTPVFFSLGTDEIAQCKYSFNQTETYDEMEEFPEELTVYSQNHTFKINMPSLDSLDPEEISGSYLDRQGNARIYVRCQDTHGNVNQNEYIVNFCIKRGEDNTPPIIWKTVPENGRNIEYGINSTEVIIYTNEPADCRYSLRSGTDYENMENEFFCMNDPEEEQLFGWPCYTNLTLDKAENNFYFRCKDQPWLTEDSTESGKRNANAEDYVYLLKKAKDILNITAIYPDEDVTEGFEPITVDLEVYTTGGSGETTCYYSFSGYDSDMIMFPETFSNKHKQIFDMMGRGKYQIYIKCEDEAGNIAKAETVFAVKIDSAPPRVVRVYNDFGALKIVTNEEAECRYSFSRCNFDFDKGTSMTTTFSTEHTAEWKPGHTYHVKCKDVFGNSPLGCTIKVMPS